MKHALGLMFLVSLFSLISCATMGGPETFEELDTDGDGYISKPESTARLDLEVNFDSIDKDGNGRLNIKEYEAYQGKGRMSPPEESEIPEPGAAPY